MPTRLKFVVEEKISVVYGTTANVAGAARHFRIESNRDVRFEFESNLEASQVPISKGSKQHVNKLRGL